MNIAIIIGSIRQNRVTDRQAKWTLKTAEEIAGEHNWYIVDLKDYNLPMFDEPLPPMAGKRPELSEGVKRYLEDMAKADGFIIVVPEYNHGMPSALKNAIDLLDYQLQKKPVAIVSHGVVGGARVNEQVRLVVNSNLGAVAIPSSLTFFGKVGEVINEDGELLSNKDVNEPPLRAVIESLIWYSDALKVAREK